jgi:soluble lytic murein transglycosylase
MQLIPSTGRRYAAKVGLRGFSTSVLKQPATNVRLGTTYFKDLMDRFGGAHLALASYNAGEGRVAKWLSERRGIPQDEFIDDIPFPETQNYVKRILGTAEDYRRLYGGGVLVAGLSTAARPAPAVSAQKPTRPASVKASPKRPASRTTRSSRSR